MSGSTSDNALLQSIAHPAQVNLLGAYQGAAQTADAIWQNRAWQAKQAAGQAFLDSVNQDGTPNQPQLLKNLQAAGPQAALAAQPSAQAGQTLDTDTQSTQMKRLAMGSAGAMQILAENNGNAPKAAMTKYYDDAFAQGMITQEQRQQLEAPFTDDAAANGTVVRQRLMAAIPAQEAIARGQPSQGPDVNAPGGGVQGTTRAPLAGPNPGAIQPVGVPVAQGPTPDTVYNKNKVSADSDNEAMTVTGADQVPHTDTKRGLKASGFLSPDGTPAAGYAVAPTQATPAMVTALRGQEATPDGRTSVSGARGVDQVTPGFFQTYAQPGESFDSKRDVATVANRGIAALEAKYPNDPARVATAYFSGPGNVSQPGSANPWIADKQDPNGASTSGYVNGVLGRYKPAPAATPTPTGGTTGANPQAVAQQATDVKSYHDQTAAYNNTDANTIANYKEAYTLGSKIATGKGLAGLADVRSGLVSLGRAVGVDTGSLDTDDQVRGELDKVLNQILVSQPGAGRSDAALGTSGAATPHLGMNTNAMLNQIRILYGQAKQQNATQLEQDPATKGVGYEANQRAMMSTTARDGFASDLMTPAEVNARIKSLGGDDAPAAKAFMRGVNKNVSIYKATPGSGLGS